MTGKRDLDRAAAAERDSAATRGSSLLSLFTPWLEGATIVAGLDVFPPARDAPKTLLFEPCPREDCNALILGVTSADLDQNLANHRGRHG